MTLNPDLNQARLLLDFLGKGEDFTFQTFAEINKDDRSVCRVLHGTFDQHAETLAVLNQRGAGIYVMVNRGDGLIHSGAKTCRTAANVIAVRALFVDLDGAPLEPVLAHQVPPDIVVQSSPDKWHAYWHMSNCPLDEFKPAQQCLAATFKGDAAVCDLPRVMRLPGFYHRKSATPHLTRVLTQFDLENLHV